MTIVTSWDAVMTIDILKANNIVKLNNMWSLHFAWLKPLSNFEGTNKLDFNYLLWQLKFNIYLPSEKPYDIALIQGFQ